MELDGLDGLDGFVASKGGHKTHVTTGRQSDGQRSLKRQVGLNMFHFLGAVVDGCSSHFSKGWGCSTITKDVLLKIH